MTYIYSFLFAGTICLIGQMILDNTKLTAGHITSIFVVLGALLDTFSIYDEIIKYEPRFKNLKGVTIFDLITFNTPLKTNGRVDRAFNKEEAEKILFDIEIDNTNNNTRPYTDMGAMVLKYVIERKQIWAALIFIPKSTQ